MVLDIMILAVTARRGVSSAKMEQALSQVANHGIHLTCAGRTDARVHATAQVAHFDSDADRSTKSWVFGATVICRQILACYGRPPSPMIFI